MASPSLSINTFNRAFASTANAPLVGSGKANSISHAAGDYACRKPSLSGNLLYDIYLGMVFGVKELYKRYNSATKVEDFVSNSGLIAAALQKYASDNASLSDGTGENAPKFDSVTVKLTDGRELTLAQHQESVNGETTVTVTIELMGETRKIEGVSFKGIYDRLVSDAEVNKDLYVTAVWLYSTTEEDGQAGRLYNFYADNFWSVTLASKLLSELIKADPVLPNDQEVNEATVHGAPLFASTADKINIYLEKLKQSGFLSFDHQVSLRDERIIENIRRGEITIAQVLRLTEDQHYMLQDKDNLLDIFYTRNLVSMKSVVEDFKSDDYKHLYQRNAIILVSLTLAATMGSDVKTLEDYLKLSGPERAEFRKPFEQAIIQGMQYRR